MREICKAIIDAGADVAAVAGVSLPGNLNMAAIQGVEPTNEEASALLKASEDFTRTARAIIHGWVARLPQAPHERKEPS